MKQIIYNGNLIDEGKHIISSDNRGLRFGDGCFETMKAVNGRIVLKELHFGRLLSSLEVLDFDVKEGFHRAIEKDISELLNKNDHLQHARIRLTIFRSEGSLYEVKDDHPNYIIESREIENALFNKAGLITDVYKDARKHGDHFSHIKSNNFLPYAMAARWVNAHGLDDALLLNTNDRIAEATMANVFILTNGIIKTPVLSEGCISGVMRKHIINTCRKEGIPVEETSISVEDLQNASEVFLTNAISGIRWVEQVGEHHYASKVSEMLYNKLVKPLWK